MGSHRCRVVLAILMVGALLSACGLKATPVPTPAPTAVPTVARAAAVPTEAPTAAPTVAPSATPAPTKAGKPTAAPSPTDEPAAVSPDVEDAAADGYATLLMIDACAVVLEETALTIAEGEADELESMGPLMVLSVLLEMLDESLAEGPPVPALEEAWDEALLALPLLVQVAEDWYGEAITSAEVLEQLAPVHRQMDRAIALADEALVDEVGIDPEELVGLREEAAEQVRQGMAEASMDDLADLDDATAEDAVPAEEVEILDIRWIIDFADDLVFIGELANVADVPVGYVEVEVTLLDDDGEALVGQTGMTLVSAIEPGGVAPFRVDFMDDPGEFADFDVVARAELVDDYMGEMIYTAFDLTRERQKESDDEEYYELLCEAENWGDEAASMVEAIVTAYDADGRVVGVGNALAEQNLVRPGQVATFDVSLSVADEVASHSILFDAYVEDVDELPELEITNLIWLDDYFGDSYCVGEITNYSSEPASSASIAVIVDDANGQLAGTDSAYSFLNVIPAGGTSPFRVTFWGALPEDGTYVATVDGDIADEWALENTYTDLEIIEHELDYSDDGDLVLTGRVENVGDVTVEYVQVVITGYDVDEDVVVAESGYLELDSLEPGESSPFVINAYAPIPVEEYLLQVEGSPAG